MEKIEAVEVQLSMLKTLLTALFSHTTLRKDTLLKEQKDKAEMSEKADCSLLEN